MNILSLVKIDPIIVKKDLKKVVIKFNKGDFNIEVLYSKIFNFISLGKFPFAKVLELCLHNSIIEEELLNKYRLNIIINLDGYITSYCGEDLPVSKQDRVYI